MSMARSTPNLCVRLDDNTIRENVKKKRKKKKNENVTRKILVFRFVNTIVIETDDFLIQAIFFFMYSPSILTITDKQQVKV